VLDADQNGSAYLLATNLPGLDQGRNVSLSQDDAGSKQQGKLLAKADLPKLQPSAGAPSAQQASGSQPLPQARSGQDTQQMHQQGK
jgi:hypothetical protein